MRRYLTWAGGLVLGLGLVLAAPRAEALITRLTPLSDVIKDSQFIFMTQVEAIDPDRPSVVLTVAEDLKDKVPFRRLPINLTGDSEATREKHTPQLLKRLAAKTPVLVFVSQRNKRYLGFAYSNGTWFQMVGHADEADAVRWSFSHCEPYLRQTYKDDTGDLRQVVLDALADHKKPPAPDKEVKPGLGPEVQPEEQPKPGAPGQVSLPGRNLSGPQEGPIFAVIPTVLIAGPLAILALLFPAVFGGMALMLRRWLVVLTMLSINSSLWCLYIWFYPQIKDFWWGNMAALWVAMTLVTLVCILWSWRRHVALAQDEAALSAQAALLEAEFGDPILGGAFSSSSTGITATPASSLATLPPPSEPLPVPVSATVPQKSEHIALWALSVLGLGVVVLCLVAKWPLVDAGWRAQLLVMWAGIWAGTIFTCWLRWHARRGAAAASALSAEGVMLVAMGAACVALGMATAPRPVSAAETIHTGEGQGPAALREGRVKPIGVVWTYEAKERGTIYSAPLVAGERVYVGGAHGNAFAVWGTLYCLDRATGKELWNFSDDEQMKQVYSTPTIAGGRLFIGEGFHQDKNCKLYCLNPDTGQKLWEFATSSHTESSPCVAGDRVYFGAGDDGVYCVEAATGKQVWNYPGVHVDANPAVVDGRLYVGSGVGDIHQKTAIFCLDAATGKEVWRNAVDLPAWGSPTVLEGQVFFGIGNGNFIESAKNPGGAVLCVDAATGKRVWTFDAVTDGVLDRPAVGGHHVYFGSRDHHCYCVTRGEGRLCWKQDLGSPVLAAPVLARSDSVYALGSEGRVCCLNPESGAVLWTFDVGKQSQTQPQLLSSPVVVVTRTPTGDSRRLYFGTGLNNYVSFAAVLYCFEDRFEDQ